MFWQQKAFVFLIWQTPVVAGLSSQYMIGDRCYIICIYNVGRNVHNTLQIYVVVDPRHTMLRRIGITEIFRLLEKKFSGTI